MRTATVRHLMIALAVAAMLPAAVARAQAPETFAATATVKTAAGASVMAPVVVTVTRWTSDADRAKVVASLQSGGSAAVKKTLEAMPEVGTIQVGDRKTPLRFARAVTTGAGRLITVAAAQPIIHLGAGVPEAKPKAGYDLALAAFEVDAAGKGSVGDLAPAAKIKLGASDSLVVEDYGVEAVRLSGIAKK